MTGRWHWLAILCAIGAACSDVELPAVSGGKPGWQTFPDTGNQEIDLLLAIDDSSDMASLQAKMLSQLPALLDVLQASPNGSPDLHVAVVSSNSGIGEFDLPRYGCPFLGDIGFFQVQARGNCVIAPLPAGQTYFQTSNGAANFSGDLASQIACVGSLGQQGCLFSGPFKSIRDGLGTSGWEAHTNAGFLRPEALLAVVLLSNKDDCSVPDNSSLGDPTQTLMSDPPGPFNRFRCNEFGHLCEIAGVLTHPPRGAATDLQGCISNESPTGRLTKVTDEVRFLQSLKSNPTRIVAAAIAGPTTPYSIDMVQEVGAPEAHPKMQPSCQDATGDYAEPAVRIQQWATALGGATYPSCADSLGTTLQAIGQSIVDRAGALCFAGPFPSRMDGADQPACRVADLVPGFPVGDAGNIIRNCLDSASGTCWTAVDDPVHCASGTKSLVINRVTPAIASSFVGVNCLPCPHDLPAMLNCGI